MSKISFDQFRDETMKALSCKSMGGPPLFVCSITVSAGGLVLTWKKVSDGVAFQLGSINLVPASNNTLEFLTYWLDRVNNLGKKKDNGRGVY